LEHDDKVSIKVSDTGRGIPQEDIPHVFDRFYRVDKSRARSSGGSGLGLAIAKKILEAHQSSISVRSVLNQGTTFRFELPVYA
nr:two-component sensor histidine kinase [Phycisphaerae bacterium]